MFFGPAKCSWNETFLKSLYSAEPFPLCDGIRATNSKNPQYIGSLISTRQYDIRGRASGGNDYYKMCDIRKRQ